MDDRKPRTNLFIGAALGLTLIILAGTIAYGTFALRHRVRQQIVRHEADLLHDIVQEQYFTNNIAEPAGVEEESILQQLTPILEASRVPFKGVLGVRLFDASGQSFGAFPANVTEGTLGNRDLEIARRLEATGCYFPAAKQADYFLVLPNYPEQFSLVEAVVPLHRRNRTNLLGVAQFVIDGESIKNEFAAIDHGLILQAEGVFLVSGTIIGVGLVCAFRRLRRANQMLEERTASLLRANHELALAAKTSAVGAVTAHLIHGLRNPLTGLQQFVTNLEQNPSGGDGSDVKEAVATTRRMQGIIAQVVQVLRDESGASQYEISFEELADILAIKVKAPALSAGITFNFTSKALGRISNREANLILLILENLVQNAVQASARGKSVVLAIEQTSNGVLFSVSDSGPGLAEHIKEAPFTPSQSTKPGGAGIGLAISYQLARQLGAELSLHCTGPSGTTFHLVMPVKPDV